MGFGDRLKETKDPSQEEFDYENYKSEIHEERIRNAPKIVRDYYNGTGIKFTKGFFKVLVATKSNRIIFMVMLMCAAIVLIKANLSGTDNIKVINNYECELTSFSYDDVVFASVKVHPLAKYRKELEKKASKDTGSENAEPFEVFIEFTGETGDGSTVVFENTCSGQIYDKVVFFRTSTADCDIITVSCTVTIDSQKANLSVKVKRKLQ